MRLDLQWTAGVALTFIALTARAQAAPQFQQVFVELLCQDSGIVIRTVPAIEVSSDWGSPLIDRAAPISITRHVMRLRDYDEKGSVVPRPGTYAHRTAKCRAGNSEIAVRISEFEDSWRYGEDVSGYVRIWINRRGVQETLLSLTNLNAKIDVGAQSIHACAQLSSRDDPGSQPAAPFCQTVRFNLWPIDTLEFATSTLAGGPRERLVLIDAADPNFCHKLGPYLDGGHLPAGFTEPTLVPAPETWAQANAAKTYRLDADNDGEIDDVAILQVDQHIYQGSLLAVFEKDSVLAGRIPPPWWADLLEQSFSKQWNGSLAKPLPPEFKSVTSSARLGHYNGFIDLILHGKVTFARSSEWYGSHHHGEPEQELAQEVIGTRRFEFFDVDIFRLKPGLTADLVCKFRDRFEYVP